MRRGWQALVRFPMVLFVGALLKACTEAGNGAGGQSRGDWDPGHSATEASRHIRDGQWDQVVDGLPAPLAAMGAGGPAGVLPRRSREYTCTLPVYRARQWGSQIA